MPREEEYLSGPQPRRWTPWLWSLGVVLLLMTLFSRSRESWTGPLALAFGAAIGGQGVDAIRTGRLTGRFPNKFPIDINRMESPVVFWAGTVVYLVMGLIFAGIGLLAVLELIQKTT
jgi:hypothetical protein